jgi:hypothetical protein
MAGKACYTFKLQSGLPIRFPATRQAVGWATDRNSVGWAPPTFKHETRTGGCIPPVPFSTPHFPKSLTDEQPNSLCRRMEMVVGLTLLVLCHPPTAIKNHV